MKELKTLKFDSDIHDFYDVFNSNKETVGKISIRKDVYVDYIKILSIFPLKEKKLENFLKLSPEQKAGFMSSYIMKIARKMNIPSSIIELFHSFKKNVKRYRKYQKTAEEIGKLMATDIREGISEYKWVVKLDVYELELSKMTNSLCSAIFEQYDKAKKNMFREQKLERIVKDHL